MAVRISIGLDKPDDKPKKINLSLLRRNTKSRKDKTSGQKVPRIGDYEVVPAPDSISEVRYIRSYVCVILIAYTHFHKCHVIRILYVCDFCRN